MVFVTMYSKYNYIHSMKENTNKQTTNKQTNKQNLFTNSNNKVI